jgi:hypothetical protein
MAPTELRGSKMSDARNYTTKQMADACEMLVMAELTLAGNPAHKMPDNWPSYDVIAQPPDREPQRISVKSRTFTNSNTYVDYLEIQRFDWLAIVIVPSGLESQRRLFIAPREIADKAVGRNKKGERYALVNKVAKLFAAYEGNFSLTV